MLTAKKGNSNVKVSNVKVSNGQLIAKTAFGQAIINKVGSAAKRFGYHV
jgi:hypothetical protein